jgi:radical SAM superfamily enzyme YgiQ (UPF0313 family)
VATALSKYGHEVSIYDTNVSTDYDAELRKLVRKVEPEIIGVGIRNLDNSSYRLYHSYVRSFLDLVSMLRGDAPASKIVAGGSGFSICALQLMERASGIDFGFFLEGEESMPELLNNLDEPQSVKGIFYRRNGSVHFTGNRELIDFTNFPIPRRDMINVTPYLENPYSMGVQTKRGCIFKCAYCTYPFLESGAQLRLRQVQSVLNELDILVNEYGIKTLSFVDSVFNVPLSHANEICEGILARGLDLQWKSSYNEKFIDKEHLKLAKDAGCSSFWFSPDGFSKSALVALNKDINEQDIHKVYSLAKRSDDVKVAFFFFVNSPGDSLGNLFRLFFFIIKSKLFLRKKVTFNLVSVIRIYPHTPLYALALKKGWVKAENDITEPVYYNPAPLCYVLKIIGLFKRLLFGAESMP